MARMVTHCMDCIHSVYCSSFGEFKCLVKTIRIYEPEKEARKCKDFKKQTKKSSDDDPKCHCKHCLAREDESE